MQVQKKMTYDKMLELVKMQVLDMYPELEEHEIDMYIEDMNIAVLEDYRPIISDICMTCLVHFEYAFGEAYERFQEMEDNYDPAKSKSAIF